MEATFEESRRPCDIERRMLGCLVPPNIEGTIYGVKFIKVSPNGGVAVIYSDDVEEYGLFPADQPLPSIGMIVARVQATRVE